MIQITLNGEPQELDTQPTVAQLLDKMNLTQRRVAVEINHEIIPKSRHQQRLVQAGDQIEIVHAIGGG